MIYKRCGYNPKYLLLFVLFVSVQSINGQNLLLEENFNYIEASTLVSNGWSQISTTASPTINIAGAPLTYPGYASSNIGDAAVVGNTGQDVYKAFSALTSGSIYLAAMVNLSDVGSGDFFMSLFYNNTYRGRLYAKSDGAGGYYFGLGKSSIIAYETTKRLLGTTYLVVIKETIVTGTTNDLVSLFVNPSIDEGEPLPTLSPVTDSGSDLAQISGVSLRQGGGAGVAPSVTVGGIRVHTNWETIFPEPPSANSDIISSKNEVTNINYATYQTSTIATTTDGAKVWSISVRDGGSSADSDTKTTSLTGFTISQGDTNQVSTWTNCIRQATLFSGTTKIADASLIQNDKLLFSNLTGIIASDDATIQIDLYLTFKTSVVDNQQFQFKVKHNNIAASGGGFSQFASFADAVSSTTGDLNRIEVTADHLSFIQHPIDVAIDTYISPDVTLKMLDQFGNQDYDFNTDINITANGATLVGTPVSKAASSGLVIFSNLKFSSTSTNATINAEKSSGDWSISSNQFVVSSSPLITFNTVTEFGLQSVNSTSAEQSYTISGAALSQNIVIAPPSGFEVSLSSGTGFRTYPSSLIITQTGGVVAPTIIYVRFAPNSAIGSVNSEITHTSGSIIRNLAVSGVSIAAEPTTQSSITFGETTSNSMVVNFAGGNGSKRILVVKANSAVTFAPSDQISTGGTISNDFALASDQDNGNKVVYQGSGSTVNVIGLQNLTSYYFAGYEYNEGANNSQNYLTSMPGTGSKIAGNRYEAEVFAEYMLTSDIQYGQSVKVTGAIQNLLLDIYEPKDDNVDKRPLIVFIHGGGFKGNSKVGSFSTMYCGNLAKCGYLVTSIDYRLSSTIANDKEHFEAMIRAIQDAKAAVRFFRKNADLYKVDTSQIYVTGSSAGSITALHMAYLNTDEIPTSISGLPFTMSTLGTLEGSSGNPEYSSKFHAVISNWGALANFRWMKEGDVPVYAVHGITDVTVPVDSSFSDGPFKYGSKIIVENTKKLGIPSDILLYPATGHTLDNNATKQFDAYKHIAAWLFTILKIRAAPILNPDLFDNDIAHNIEISFTDNQAWRDSIVWVKVNNTPLKRNTDFEIVSGKVILKPSGGNTLLTTRGSKSVTIEARGYQDAKVVQEITTNTNAENGLFEDKVKLYTVKDNLIVTINDNRCAYIEVYDLLGRVVRKYKMTQSEQTFSIDGLNGVYLVRVQSISGVYSKKVILGML